MLLLSQNPFRLSFTTLKEILVIAFALCLLSPQKSLLASSENLFLQAIPESPMKSSGTEWVYDVTTSPELGVSNSAWSVNFPETDVFLARLKHQQPNNEAQSWELRLGKGGQIYSLTNTIDGVTKEYIPPQYHRQTSPFGYSYAPWVDEVFQVVSVNPEFNRTNHPYFIHQSGIYLSDPTFRQVKPFFSPLLAHGEGNQSNSYVTINWGQHAHVPSLYPSALIYYTQVRDVGEGIIEITNLIYNFGVTTPDRFNVPWGGTRRTSLGTHIMSNPPDVSGWKEDRNSSQWGNNSFRNINDTNGWMAFAEGTNPNHRALGLVFGFDAVPFKEFQTSESFWRWGFAGEEEQDTGEAEWRNYLVGTLIRKIRLEPGSILLNRYYLIVDSLGNIENAINQHQLNQKAGYEVFTYSAEESPTLSWFLDTQGELTTNLPQEGSKPIIITYAWPVQNSKPVFLIENATTSEKVITTNPYVFCRRMGDNYCRPYDGNTIYHGFLGYSDQLVQFSVSNPPQNIP